MATMTLDELKKTMRSEVMQILSTEVDRRVAEAVRDSLAKSAGPRWMSQILDQQGAPARKGAGELAGFVIRCAAASCMHAKAGMAIAPEAIAQSWGLPEVGKMIVDARAKALAAGDPLAGGTLVPEQFAQDFVELLRPISVVRRMGAVTLPMPVGSMKIPKITSGMTAYYIGENTNITKTQLATGQIALVARRLAGLTPVSNDLLRYSSPAADAIVRDDAVGAVGQAENTYFLRGDGMAGVPKGLRYQMAAGNLIGAAVTSLANVTIDLGKCVRALMAANSRFTRPGWIISPRSYMYLSTVQTTTGAYVIRDELMRGQLWGWPYGISTGVPENLTDGGNTDESEVYFADFADVVIGEAQVILVDASTEATYSEGGSLQSAFSLDQTVVRIITAHDLAVRRAESVVVLNKVRWGT